MTTESLQHSNLVPVFKPQPTYRNDTPHKEVLRELLENRTYQEILGAFTHNETVGEDSSIGPIAMNPYDIETLRRLGLIDKSSELTRRGRVAIRCIQIDRAALEHGIFDVTFSDEV